MSQWTVPKLFVGKNGANTLTAPTNAITSLNSITAQDIYFIDADGGATHGNILDATTIASVSKFSVVGNSLNQDGTLKPFISEPINRTSIKKAAKDAYTAPVQQVTYLGYDGTATTPNNDLAVTNSNNYRLNISLKVDNPISEFKEPFGPVFGALTGFAATTPTLDEKLNYIWQFVKVVNGDTTQSNFFANSKKRTGLSTYINAELVSDATGTAFTNAVTIANGSTTLTSTAHGRTAGQFIRIGATSATVTTNGIYKIASITDANTLELESPYKGTSLSAVAAAAAHTLAVNSKVGIRLTGKDVPFARYSQKMFVRFFSSFLLDNDTRNSTTGGSQFAATTPQIGVNGSGTPDLIKEKEISYWGYLGFFNYGNWPPIEPNTYSTTGLTYDIYSIEFNQFGESDFDVARKLKTVELALVTGSSQNTALGLVVAALPNYVSIS